VLEEMIASAKAQATERLASPLTGSFLIAWCLWNYKFIVILFSAASVSKTFEMINSVAFPDAWTVATRGLLLPLLTAAAYIFVYPYRAKFVYGFTRRRQKEQNDLRRQIENETPLTLEESRKLRGEALAAEAKHKEELDQLNTEFARVKEDALQKLNDEVRAIKLKHKEELDHLVSKHAQQKEIRGWAADPKLLDELAHMKEELERMRHSDSAASPDSSSPGLTPSQKDVLVRLGRVGGSLSHDVVARGGVTNHELVALQRLNLVDREFSKERGYTYQLTPEGRRVRDHLPDDLVVVDVKPG
jgi:hypothetical protein